MRKNKWLWLAVLSLSLPLLCYGLWAAVAWRRMGAPSVVRRRVRNTAYAIAATTRTELTAEWRLACIGLGAMSHGTMLLTIRRDVICTPITRIAGEGR